MHDTQGWTCLRHQLCGTESLRGGNTVELEALRCLWAKMVVSAERDVS